MPVSDVMPTETLTAEEALKAVLKLAESDDYESLAGSEMRTLLKAIAQIAGRTLDALDSAPR